MSERGTRNDLLVAAGVLLSLVIATVSTILSDLTASILLVVALAGVVLALQVDLVLRLIQRTRLDALNLRVLGLILGADHLAPPLADLARNIVRFRQAGRTSISALAHAELNIAVRELHQLQSGQVVRPDGDTTLMIEQLLRLTRTIHATTFVEVDEEWWSCPAGRTYLEANAEAIDRGATVERVLVYETWNATALAMATEQRTRGVTVYRIRKSSLEPELVRNIVVYDENFLVEDEVSLDGAITGCMHAVDEATVNGALAAFRRIRSKAEEFRLP